MYDMYVCHIQMHVMSVFWCTHIMCVCVDLCTYVCSLRYVPSVGYAMYVWYVYISVGYVCQVRIKCMLCMYIVYVCNVWYVYYGCYVCVDVVYIHVYVMCV